MTPSTAATSHRSLLLGLVYGVEAEPVFIEIPHETRHHLAVEEWCELCRRFALGSPHCGWNVDTNETPEEWWSRELKLEFVAERLEVVSPHVLAGKQATFVSDVWGFVAECIEDALDRYRVKAKARVSWPEEVRFHLPAMQRALALLRTLEAQHAGLIATPPELATVRAEAGRPTNLRGVIDRGYTVFLDGGFADALEAREKRAKSRKKPGP
jgi:hypothetical protein